MDVVNPRCAGLDVHKATVVACVRGPDTRRSARHAETKTFSTTVGGLTQLREWLLGHGVTTAALESTSVYWRPVYAALEDRVELVLVNARHVKMVPGRKTDVRDCEWLAHLLECGLLRASLVPPRAIRDLRDLTRLRKSLVRERGHHVNRIAKILELAQLKLSCVVTDIMGKTGRAILEALALGIDDPAQLAAGAQGSLRKTRAELREALRGGLTPHYAFLLQQHLSLIDTLDTHLVAIDARIEGAMVPFAAEAALGETIPGIATRSAQAIVAETGRRHESLPDGCALGVVGTPVSRQSRERGKATRGGHGEGGDVASCDAAGDGLGRRADQEELLPRAFPSNTSPRRGEEGYRRRAARHYCCAVAHPQEACCAPRSRSGLLRSSQHRSPSPPSHQTPRAAWLQRRARRQGGVTGQFHRKRP